MMPLPSERYVFAEWKRARVHIDYHIEIDEHSYSVPYALVGRELEVRVTAHTVEALQRGQRVASHVRSPQRGKHTTHNEHMRTAHRRYAEWTPQRLIAWAAKTGPATAKLIDTIMATRAHPQQGFRSCPGIMRLGKSSRAERLEAACVRALALGAYSYRSLESILRRGLEQQALPDTPNTTPSIAHDNVCGAEYYH
jgi:transposase